MILESNEGLSFYVISIAFGSLYKTLLSAGWWVDRRRVV